MKIRSRRTSVTFIIWAAKREILQQLAAEHTANTILVQETHQTTQEHLKLHGFLLADHIPSKHHGIATFIKNNINFSHIGNSEEEDPTEWIAIKIGHVEITNVYHPPPAIFDPSCLPAVSEQFILSGDLNCRHETWGYPNANSNGENLANWVSLNNLVTLFDPKQPASFHSGRWNRGTNPDIAFCTQLHGITPVRSVLGRFPRSQHRASLISTPPLICTTGSAPLPRWNFRKADWDHFTAKLEETAEQLPIPDKRSVNRDYRFFTNLIKSTAKKFIPRGFRKSYIPMWDDECAALYQTYEEAEDPSDIKLAATNLLGKLDEKRQARWKETIAGIDFTHSSRKAWHTVNRLTGRNTVKKNCPVHPNDIAKQLLRNSSYQGADKSFKREVKREVSASRTRSCLPEEHHLSLEFSTNEIEAALVHLKSRKSPGPDGIHNEFLKNLGPKLIAWLTLLFNTCLNTAHIPNLWRRANVIAVLKPGKDEKLPTNYRPISLLCIPYKLLERVILARITPTIEGTLPQEQAGFRQGRSTLDQLIQLTDNIEESHDKGQFTGAIFLDLTAAYDTVWLQGLHLKLQHSISCSKITDLIMCLLYNRSFVLYAGCQMSKPFRLKNGVAQGSVLAPTLYNIYTSDFPQTSSQRYMYADDVCLTFSSKSISTVETTLTSDMAIVRDYYHKWHLKLSPNKTVSSCFHLRNRLSGYKLKVTLSGNQLPFDPSPKYLGITLDRSLTYRDHLQKLASKMSSRVALVKRMAGTTWGASFEVLRITTLALVVAPAEYCAPVWTQSTHTQKLNVPFNEALRTISGCIRCTKTNLLPTLSGIKSLKNRRRNICEKLFLLASNCSHPLHRTFYSSQALTRLRSRHPLRNLVGGLPEEDNSVPTSLSDFISEWSSHPPGHDLPRHAWVQLNRLRSGAGKFAADLVRWGLRESGACRCGAEIQTHRHIIDECPILKPPCSLSDVTNPQLLSFLLACDF